MHKLCFVIVLHFVIKIALGDANENSFNCICPDRNETLVTAVTIADNDEDGFNCSCPYRNEEFYTPEADKNVVFVESFSTPEMEQQLDRVVPKENEQLDTVIATLNGIEALLGFLARNSIVYPRSCRDERLTGIYEIQVGPASFEVFCEEELFDGGWTVIARRMNGLVNFADRNWTEYKEGFGDLNSEFFIGMDKLYVLTNGLYTQELIFVLEDFNYTRKYAKYSAFAIGDESEGYKIKTLGDYSGDAGDSFTSHRNQIFKTKDRDSTNGCTQFGAWWYEDCYESNLFGMYLNVDEPNREMGIAWNSWTNYEFSLKFVQMMIRTKTT